MQSMAARHLRRPGQELALTVVVGIEDDGQVLIGADSAGVAGWSMQVRSDTKVFRNGPYVIGFTTSFRMGQLLRFVLDPPAVDSWDVDRFMVARFVPAVRDCLKVGGFTTIESNEEKGGTFLVGIAGRLYEVSGDFQVGRSTCGYAAVGAGFDLALGSLHSTRFTEWPAADRVTMALEAAEAHSAAVSGPFNLAMAP